MTGAPISLFLQTPDDTARAAKRLGGMLEPGDTVLLSGDVGAGKTHFARALIQSQLKTPEDVPSPTFTLVQTYAGVKAEIWHADLYRLTGTQEIEELGLTDAFDGAVCIVEWPDRLGELAPSSGLLLTFEPGAGPDERRLTIVWKDPRWHDKVDAWLR